jgi:predicted metal-dependent HD superfamily phosphohydrolase
LEALTDVKSKIQNWDTILFSVFYHDIIYSALKPDNEEQSAELAGKRMQQMGLPGKMIQDCKAQILATKKHLASEDTDTNYFTDADLSILGQDWDAYSEYFENVRKEYAFYPDMVYNAGRRKMLKQLLSMDRIFKTAYFFDRYETQAKLNLFRELRSL